MSERLAAEFATSMEGHYTTHQVGWLDYLLIAVSTVAVLITVYYTFKYMLPREKKSQPKIMQQILDDQAGES